MPQDHDSIVTISLLDPVGWQPIQTWEFNGASVIRIGRAKTNDVVVSDTLVSRIHGELVRTDTGWSVVPLGRNGIAIGSREVNSATPLPHQTVLRLANSGPYLEFCVGGRRRNAKLSRPDGDQWSEAEVREREEERQRAEQTDATEPDFIKRHPQR